VDPATGKRLPDLARRMGKIEARLEAEELARADAAAQARNAELKRVEAEAQVRAVERLRPGSAGQSPEGQTTAAGRDPDPR
jgi:hypothetical protein